MARAAAVTKAAVATAWPLGNEARWAQLLPSRTTSPAPSTSSGAPVPGEVHRLLQADGGDPGQRRECGDGDRPPRFTSAAASAVSAIRTT